MPHHPCRSYRPPCTVWPRNFPIAIPAPGLTETRILQTLEREPELAGKLFGKVLDLETAQFMGDLSFAARLDSLAFAPVPLIEGLAQPLLGHMETYETYFTSGLAITELAGRCWPAATTIAGSTASTAGSAALT